MNNSCHKWDTILVDGEHYQNHLYGGITPQKEAYEKRQLVRWFTDSLKVTEKKEAICIRISEFSLKRETDVKPDWIHF